MSPLPRRQTVATAFRALLLLTCAIAWGAADGPNCVAADPAAEATLRRTDRSSLSVLNRKLLSGDSIPAERTPLGIPNDYKPWIARLKSGQLLIVGFCYGGQPSNELAKGEPYLERAVFWRSDDNGKTWQPREERPDIHGREFSLNVLADGTLLMPCHLLANDAANKAGYTHSKLFRSTDEARTWSEERIGPEGFPEKAQTTTDWTAIEIPDRKNPQQFQTFFGVSISSGGAAAPRYVAWWRSEDGGRTWDKSRRPDTAGWSDVDGFFCQSTTFRARSGRLFHPVRVDRTGPHWKLPGVDGTPIDANDNGDRSILFVSDDDGNTWRKNDGEGRFGTYGEMYPRFLALADGRILLTFTVRSGSSDGYVRGLRAVLSNDDGKTWDFTHDRIVIDAQNHGESGGGFGNTVQLDHGTLVSCYSYRGKDGKTHVEAVRWRLPVAQ